MGGRSVSPPPQGQGAGSTHLRPPHSAPSPSRAQDSGRLSLRSAAPSASAAGSAWPPRCHSPSPAPCRAAERGRGETVRAAPPPAPSPRLPRTAIRGGGGGRTRTRDPSQGEGGQCCSFRGKGGHRRSGQAPAPCPTDPSLPPGEGGHKSPSTHPHCHCPPSTSPLSLAAHCQWQRAPTSSAVPHPHRGRDESSMHTGRTHHGAAGLGELSSLIPTLNPSRQPPGRDEEQNSAALPAHGVVEPKAR